MTESIVSVLKWVELAIDWFGLTLLILGFARGALGWVRTELRREPWDLRVGSIRKLRCMVGVHILFALELMIVSDIIGTFLAVGGAGPGQADFFHSEVFYALVELAFIVMIRTVIDYFLGKEIDELRAATP